MKPLIKFLTTTLLLLSLNACVAVWGKGYNIIYSNSEGMMIQYDPAISGPATIAKVAQAEADKYGRVIVPGDHERAHYMGIDQRYYKFVKPTEAGRIHY